MEQNYSCDARLMQKRLKAVLAYDGVQEHKMHLYLAVVLCVSIPIAKRILFGHGERSIKIHGIKISRALDITVNWFYFGELDQWHIRTLRINMQCYKGYPKADTDKAMRFLLAFSAGQSRAKNLFKLVESGDMDYISAVRVC